MTHHDEPFTTRQTINDPCFEIFHWQDAVPIDVALHTHDFYEVYFLLRGDVDYTIEGRTYALRAGDLLLTCSQDIHRPVVRPGKPYERYVLWIQPAYMERMSQLGDNLSACFDDAAQRAYKLVRPSPDMYAHLQRLCERLCEVHKSGAYGAQILRHAYLAEFLVDLNRGYFDNAANIQVDVTENHKINEVVDYICCHLQDDISLDGLSDVFYISKYYLNSQFKAYMGMPLYQYIMKKRLTMARQRLAGGLGVMDACYACGFKDYSNFFKAFKREFGKNPKEYSRGAGLPR